jgi:uncharacterized protein
MKFGRRWFLGSAAAGAAARPGAGAPHPAASALAKSLAAELDKVRLFDVHEHLIPEKDRIGQQVDFFTLAGHYALNDAISAGLEGAALGTVRDPKAPSADRWKAFEPHWRAARHTGYGQALSLAIADIYGVAEISSDSLPAINAAIASRNKPGLYDEVLRNRARIDWCLVDAYWSPKPTPLETPYFLLSQRFDGFIAPSSAGEVRALEGISGVSIHSLQDLKRAAESTFEQGMRTGMAAVKSGLAYRRELLFHEVPEDEAAADFERLMKGGVDLPKGFHAQTLRVFRKLEDHMFHHVVRLADAHRRPFQIHTGLLAGNSCLVQNTRPTLLSNLFYLYPRVKFDIFHIGYPYQQELAVLAKLFPNVYADFCWAHVISPPGARRALDEYLETVPANKILGFGGDYRYPELTYAHARMARANVAQVLAEKVESGVFRENEALETGRMLLRDNAIRLFGVREPFEAL